ncbi:hypothetical protein ACMFMG_010213 [Clarireedia jacksonii]
MLSSFFATHQTPDETIEQLLGELHLKENEIESLRKQLDNIYIPRGHESPNQPCAKEKAEIEKLKGQLRAMQAARDVAVENMLLAEDYVAAVADGYKPLDDINNYRQIPAELQRAIIRHFGEFHINPEASYLRQDEIEEELRKAKLEKPGDDTLVDEINQKREELSHCEERIQEVKLKHDAELASIVKERDEWKARAEKVEIEKGAALKETTELLNNTENHLQNRKKLEDTIFQLRSNKGSGKGSPKKLKSIEENRVDQSNLIDENVSRLATLTEHLVEIQDELERANTRVYELEQQLKEDQELGIRRRELGEVENLIATRENQIAKSSAREENLKKRIREYEIKLSAAKMENRDEDNRLLRAEIDELQRKLAQTLPLPTREDMEKEIGQLKIDYELCRAEYANCDDSTYLGKLNSQIFILEDEVRGLKRAIKTHREQLGSKVKRLERELADRRKKSATAKTSESNKLREELVAVRAVLNMYSQAVDEYHQDKLIYQIEEIKTELIRCQEEGERLEEDKAQLQGVNDRLEEENQQLQAEILQSENDNTKLQEEIEQLENEVNTLQADDAMLNVDEIEDKNAILEARIAELESQLAIATDVIEENIWKSSGYEEQSAADEANTEHIARIETLVEEVAHYQQQIADLEQRIAALPSHADFEDIQDQLAGSTARLIEIQAHGLGSNFGEELTRLQEEVVRLSGQEQRVKILIRERDRALQLRNNAEESWKEAQSQLQVTCTERDSMLGESPSQGMRRIRRRIAVKSRETREANRRVREKLGLDPNAVDDSQVDSPELSPRSLRKRSESQSMESKERKADSKLTEAVRSKPPPDRKRPGINLRDSEANSSKSPVDKDANSAAQTTKMTRQKSIKEKPAPTKMAAQETKSGPKKRTIIKNSDQKGTLSTLISPQSGAKRSSPSKRTTETRKIPLFSLFHNNADVEGSATDDDFVPNLEDENSSDDQLSEATSSEDVIKADSEPEKSDMKSRKKDGVKPRSNSKPRIAKAYPPKLDLTKKKKNKRVRFDDGTWKPSKNEEYDEDEDNFTPLTAVTENRDNMEDFLGSDKVEIASPSLGKAKRERKRSAKAIENSELHQPKKKRRGKEG